MANWTNIPTDRIEPGKPIRAIDGLALRDNPIAIAEGASGAPKIREAAISTNSINGNRLRTNSVPNDRLVNKTVTNAKIADNTITGALFNNGSVRSWIGSQGSEAIGTYTLARATGGIARGQIISGSIMTRAAIDRDTRGGRPAGSWRLMSDDTTLEQIGLYLRVS